jgi:hypothetical protein
MASRVVKANELKRVLDVLEKRGVIPTTFDLLPGGAVRLHRVPPAANDTTDLDRERAEWDAALE